MHRVILLELAQDFRGPLLRPETADKVAARILGSKGNGGSHRLDTGSNMRKTELRGKARLRAEIVEAKEGLHKLGMISDDELARTTSRMLGNRPRVAERMEDLDSEALEAIAKAEVPAQFAELDKIDLG
jgi:hypothetical protein